MLTRNRLTLILATVGLALPLAFAQPPEFPKAPPAEAPALGGPKVEDRAVPGVQGAGFGTEAKDRKDRTLELPHQVWIKTLRETIGESAPVDLRATSDQEKQIKELNSAFQAEQRKFMEAHRDEFKGMGGRGGPGGPGAGPGGAGGGAPDQPMDADAKDGAKQADRQAMRERLNELRQQGPKAGDVQTKVFALLTPAQQAAFTTNLEEATKKFKERAAEGYKDKEAKRFREKFNGPDGQGGPGAKGGKGGKNRRPGAQNQDQPPPPPPGGGAMNDDRDNRGGFGGGPGGGPGGGRGRGPVMAREPGPREFEGRGDGPRRGDGPDDRGGPGGLRPEQRERVMRLLSRIPPEQVDMILDRLEQRMGERMGAGPRGRGPGGPDMDDREVDRQGPGGRPGEEPRRPRPPRDE